MSERHIDFSLPKLWIFRWLTASSTPVPEHIQLALISTLHSSIIIFFGGVVATLSITFATVYHFPEPLFIAWLAFDIVLAASRIGLTFYCHRLAEQGRPTPTDLHLFLVILWAGSLGFGVVTTAMTGNVALMLVAWVAYAAMSGGMCFRNYGAPRLATLMLAMSIGPMIPAALMSGDTLIYVVAAQAGAYVFAMRSAIGNLNAVLLKSMHAETEQAHRARHDSLTGLLNRAGLEHNVVHMLGPHRQCPADMGVLGIDLDGFKPVNDTHGHSAGDALLVMVAERIRGCVGDMDLAARMGGDEFTVVLTNQSPATLSTVAQRIIDRLSQPYALPCGKTLKIGASVGAAMPRPGIEGFDDVAGEADKALYTAKAEGRGVVCLSLPAPALASDMEGLSAGDTVHPSSAFMVSSS